jgi:hypothetical protein
MMNFVFFALSLICFGYLFWHVLMLVIFLPTMGVAPLLVWVTEGERTPTKRLLFLPVLLISFFFGTFLPAAFYSGGVYAITSHFAQEATHAWLYVGIGGLLCFWFSAPSGETSLLAILTSLACYILFMTVLGPVGQRVADMGDTIIGLGIAVMLAFLVGLLVWALGAEAPSLARPKVVSVALTLLYATLGVGLLRSFAEGRLARILKTAWEMPIVMALLLSLIFGSMIALYRKVGQGRNWARVTLLVFFVLLLPFGILDLIQRFEINAVSATLASVQELMAGAAIVLLFTPLANSWFRAVKANRKQLKTAEPSPPPLPRARGGHSEGEG